MLQYFEWYLPADGAHWERARQDAAHLAELGFTDLWLPPAYKGNGGIDDVGYGVYDLYDLGEFDQKGSIPTKYGTREAYLAAIEVLHAHGLRVLADVVLNHRMGAEYPETVMAAKYAPHDRLREIVQSKKIKAWTGFRFPARRQRYSAFKWDHRHFTAVDYNAKTQVNAVYKLKGHRWAENVDREYGNYDYLMGADVDFANPEVREELERWGKWYLDTTGVDGLRLDAVKHISSVFFVWWLKVLRRYRREDFFAVGEYWHSDLGTLLGYLEKSCHVMSLFDVSLHFRFVRAGHEGAGFDLRTIFDDTLVSREPGLSVTFVDNHDTQPGQALESWVPGWFKPLAYALILLREQGDPCVFYGDLYGIPFSGIGPVRELEGLLMARKRYGHGCQTDYFDHPNVIGWTREGGMAVVLSNGSGGWKGMKLGYPGQVFIDLLGNRTEEITIREDGWADFTVNGGSVSVWVPKE
jgi:alpha-amylase